MVEVAHGDVDNPSPVEIDERMAKGSFFGIRLEECAIPIDLVKIHEFLSWRKIHKSRLCKDQHLVVRETRIDKPCL